MKRHPAFLAAAALLLLAGCAANLPVVAFDHGGAPVHSIALVTPAVPEKPVLVSLAPVTAAPILVGIVGAAIDHSVQEDHAAHFAAILSDENFAPAPQLLEQLTTALQAAGYQVTTVSADRAKVDYLEQYPAAPGVDAYLDVVVDQYGYFTTTASAPYQPALGVRFRLVRAADHSVAMVGHYAYSILRRDDHPPPAYNYRHYVDFDGDHSRIVEGIREGMRRAAAAVVTALK